MEYPRTRRVRGVTGLTGPRIKPAAPGRWYRIENATAVRAEIYVYGEIGWGEITASDFVRDLRAVTADRIDLRINSHGGEVWDGLAIYEALRRHRAQVVTYIDGIAASISSVIAMAGDRRVIAPNANLMIHEASGVVAGNAAEMLEVVELLDKASDNIASVYAERAGGDVEAWREAMKRETWFSADEAVAAGLVHEVADHDGQADVDYAFAARMRYAVGNRLDVEATGGPAVEGDQARAEHEAYVRAAILRESIRGAAREAAEREGAKRAWTPLADKLREALDSVRPTVDDRGWWGGAGHAW